MNKTFTLLVGWALLMIPGLAQVSINQATFPRMASFTDSVSSTLQTGIALPTHGPGQVWDYSSLTAQSQTTTLYLDATNDPIFPDALNKYRDDRIFQGFVVPNHTYHAINANGWFEYGISTSDTAYSLQQVTGMAGDSLYFIVDHEIHDGQINFVQFPTTYQDQWSQSRKQIFAFQLTVAAFGLNKSYGFQKKYRTDHREVVGYGKLTIPDKNGSPSGQLDVLLMKVVRTAIDSFFIGGTPAPQPLLSAFGVTQGIFAADSFYVFYMPDFPSAVLNLNLNSSGQVKDAHYRPAATRLALGVPAISIKEAICFPNPAKAGQTLAIHDPYPGAPAQGITLMDIQGRTVHRQTLDRQSGNALQFTLPQQITPGLYLLQIDGQEGQPSRITKLLIQ